jgi:hypothetical protein
MQQCGNICLYKFGAMVQSDVLPKMVLTNDDNLIHICVNWPDSGIFEKKAFILWKTHNVYVDAETWRKMCVHNSYGDMSFKDMRTYASALQIKR